MNHVLGCSHGCRYPCYAFLMARRFGRVESHEEWCKPVLVSNTLELLEAEIPKLKGKIPGTRFEMRAYAHAFATRRTTFLTAGGARTFEGRRRLL